MFVLSRFLFLYTILTGALWPSVARADAPKSLFGAPLPAPNGFDSFLSAIDRYVRGEEGSPANDEDVPVTENLRRQRNSVGRNRRTLRTFRDGLALPVQHPPVREFAQDFGYYGGFKNLANLLKQESAVRISDIDWPGAMNSNLDCIELGVTMARGGPLRASLIGREIENLGRRDLEPIINKLSAKECLGAAARLAKIETLRPLFADALREEKVTDLALTRQAFEQLDWLEVVAQTTKQNGEYFTAEEKSVLANAGESEVMGNLTRVLDAVLKGADSAYLPEKTGVPRASDPWSRLLTDAVVSPTFRVDYEAARAQNMLLQLALELRAAKLQAGKYPQTLQVPTDPFADPSMGESKLKYNLTAEAYALYSVGPNGKDDGGTPLAVSASGAIAPSASGDLFAPVFSQ